MVKKNQSHYFSATPRIPTPTDNKSSDTRRKMVKVHSHLSVPSWETEVCKITSPPETCGGSDVAYCAR